MNYKRSFEIKKHGEGKYTSYFYATRNGFRKKPKLTLIDTNKGYHQLCSPFPPLQKINFDAAPFRPKTLAI